jgi:hypothetical protein
MTRPTDLGVIMLISVIGAGLHAQSNPAYTTVVVEYLGKSDRPVFPIIISSSTEEAEWYKHKPSSDPLLSLAEVYIVQESTMKKISEISLPNGDLNGSSSGEALRTAPFLRVVLATRHHSKELAVQVEMSVTLLSEIKKRVPQYPLLVERLSEIQGRMERYLEQPR